MYLERIILMMHPSCNYLLGMRADHRLDHELDLDHLVLHHDVVGVVHLQEEIDRYQGNQ